MWRKEKKKKKGGERRKKEKENVRPPELLVSGAYVREWRRPASMSDPSESWVNNPGLFAALPLLL